MIVPYGILRKPYFHTTNMTNLYDVKKIAHNFGAIGSVIGHEMIHGFDDQGRKFDKNGNLNKDSSWWEAESEEKYKGLVDKIITEYSKYKLNPKLTLGENIADVGGLRVTYNSVLNLIDENYENYKKSKNTNIDTKEKAVEKLDNMKFIIGTDALIDFSNIDSLVSNNYVANFKTLVNYVYYYRIKFLKKYEEVFFGNIYDVNAYYNPTMNFMIFPYGILRPPYFYNTDMKNLDNINIIAYNFGALGSVIGHEMIHGFDDQGRKFDKNGVLDLKSTWWEKESEERYNKLTDIIIEKYKRYRVNPKLTLGENIADVGGLRVTYNSVLNLIDENYESYKKSKNTDFDSKEKLIKKANKSFIKAWCTIWRSKIKPQEYENHIQNDPHSPAHARVNVPLNFIFEKGDGDEFKEKKTDRGEQIW